MKNICTSVRVILRDQRPNISSVASQYCEAKSPKPHHIRPFFFFKSQGKANNPSRISLLLFIRHCGISVQIYNMYSHCAGQSRPTLNTPCSKKPLPLRTKEEEQVRRGGFDHLRLDAIKQLVKLRVQALNTSQSIE